MGLTKLLILLAASCLTVLPAQATDMAYTEASGAPVQDGRVLRLGLAKSAVIKLPAAVKDVVVGDSDVVDVVIRNQRTAYLFARGIGGTNVFFFDADGREILHLDLDVAPDLVGMKKLLDRALPGNDIQLDSSGAGLVLKGTVATAQDAKMAEDLVGTYYATSRKPSGEGTDRTQLTLVNLLKITQSDQVMLKVKVVELRRTIIKELGVDLSAQFSIGNLDLDLQNNLLSTISPLNRKPVLTGTLGTGGATIEATVRALESQNLATVLAEPTLTAISGASASFLAGGEFPFVTCSQSGTDQTCETEYKPYGVQLAFTPTVLTEGRISLNISTEVSDIIERVGQDPRIDTRNAQTTVEIPSGGSMMMAGLIKDVTEQDLRGTPGLRSVPVLGALFASRQYQKDQSELVVIVTPYIAKSTQEKELATPLDGFNPPTDLQQIFLGRLNRVYGQPSDAPTGVYHGRIGHIID